MTEHNLPILSVSSIDFKKALNVVNRTKRFIIPVPKLLDGGEYLVIPEESEKAGQVIKALRSGKPDKGIVFYNGTDNAWQATKGDGRDAILINNISNSEGAKLYQKYQCLRGGNEIFGLQEIKSLLKYAKESLGIVDFYNKKFSSVQRDMKIIDEQNPLFMEVSKKDIHRALLVPDPFAYQGPVLQIYPKGAVLVNKGKYTWGVDKDVFKNSYKVSVGGRERPINNLEQEFQIPGRTKRVVFSAQPSS